MDSRDCRHHYAERMRDEGLGVMTGVDAASGASAGSVAGADRQWFTLLRSVLYRILGAISLVVHYIFDSYQRLMIKR